MLQLKGQFSALSTMFLMMQMISAAFAQGSNNISFSLRHHRNRNGNVLTLYCQNSSDLNETRAVFFLNNTLLSPANHPGFFDYSNEKGVVVFSLTRRLEGQYSCGIGELRSTAVAFISKLLP